MSNCFRLLMIVAISGLSATHALAADWPEFRGRGGSGIADDRNYVTAWSATQNVAWRIELPGPGASSPIVWGETIFVTCYRGVDKTSNDVRKLERVLVCLNRNDGKELWTATVNGTENEDAYRGFIQGHGYATSTPVTDGERVYVFFGKAGVLAFDMEGKRLWHADVGNGSARMGWGQGSSLVLLQGKVIVPAFAESKALYAFDGATGQQLWKSPADGFDGSWTSPVVVDLPDGKQELAISVPFEIWGFDPNNGDFLWVAEGIKEQPICPTLVSRNGVVYGIGGRQGGAVAVRAGGRDDVTKTHTVWRKEFGSYVTSPVLHEDHLYWVSDRGIAFCARASDGEQVYRERLEDASQLYSSVVIADGHIFAVSRENGTFVYPAKPKFESVARNLLDEDAGTCNATPAFSNGQIFFRSNKYLYCLAKK